MPRSHIDFPSLLAAVAILAYWAEVVRMVRRARRRHRHAANVVPAERVGRMVRWLWAPAVFVWIVMPWLVAFGISARTTGLRKLWHLPTLSWVGTVLIIFGWLATRVCWERMGASWRMGIDPAEKTALIATGPYAHVRHPIYALSQLMMASTVAVAPTPVMILSAVIHFMLLQWEARREEAHLLKVHGQGYGNYLARVPRFIPSLKTRWNESRCTRAGGGSNRT